jgi:hypothetical protein
MKARRVPCEHRQLFTIEACKLAAVVQPRLWRGRILPTRA